MHRWALALLPVAAAFNDELVDTLASSVLDSLAPNHFGEFRPTVAEHLPAHQLPLHLLKDAPLNKQDTCGSCAQGGTKWLMEHGMNLMKAKCANVSSSNSPKACVFEKICFFMGKHPKVALGMMFEHMRPMSLLQAYCTGKGVCGKPDDLTLNEILMGEQPHEALLKNFDQIDWSSVIDSAKEMGPNKTESFGELAPQCQTPEQAKVCPYCMRKMMKKAVMMAVKKIIGMCHESKCHIMAKMCPWMKENKAVAFGMLLAKVEPWKFAMGWCMSKSGHRDHHHGDHHHGDHDHGWHHHHHDENHAEYHVNHEQKGFKGEVWGHVEKLKGQEPLISV